MSQICCTVKLLKELGVPVNSCPKPETGGHPFGTWIAVLFYSGGRKCVLFFNPATSVSAIALYAKRAQIRDMGNLARGAVASALDSLDLAHDAREKIMAVLEGVRICKTDDRASLACINQIMLMVKYWLVEERVGTLPVSEGNLAHWLNASNMVRYKWPVNVLRQVLAELHWA